MIFKELDGGLSVIDNLKVAGAKEGKYGGAVIVSGNSDASAVFTSNKIVAGPVIYTKQVVEKGKVSAVFVNSGNANCFTGNQGIEDCESLVELVSKELNIPKGEIAISTLLKKIINPIRKLGIKSKKKGYKTVNEILKYFKILTDDLVNMVI